MDSPEQPVNQPPAPDFDPVAAAAPIAKDYLENPFSHTETGPYAPGETPTENQYSEPHEVKVRDQHIDELQVNNENLTSQNQILRAEARKNKAEAISDTLTGLLNRRGAEMAYDRLREDSVSDERRKDAHRKAYALILDLDDFKQQNDTNGHAAGDKILKQIAEIGNKNVRRSDFVARWGGDEFVILAPGMTVDRADEVATALRQDVKDLTPITTSIGICEIDFENTLEETVAKADAALYEAKKAGKNVVVHFNPSAGASSRISA